jgi:dihydrofolate reductase
MKLSIVVAMDKNRVIGKEGNIPWNYPKDLEHFKSLTTGHVMIMGRKTFDSFDGPLPNRKHIVLSRSKSNYKDKCVLHAYNIEESIKMARRVSDDEVFVIGGEEIYRQFIDRVDKMIISHIDDSYDGDTYFPDWERQNWNHDVQRKYENFTVTSYHRIND